MLNNDILTPVNVQSEEVKWQQWSIQCWNVYRCTLSTVLLNL